MKAEEAASLMISIARKDVGNVEASHNNGAWIKKLWPATDYPDGYVNREPYCAAGLCYVLQQFIIQLRDKGELQKTLGMTFKGADKWRCKSARAFGWRDWAKRVGAVMLPDTVPTKPGDFIVYDFSHVGLSLGMVNSNTLRTIEYNTNAGGSREGDGCWDKVRNLSTVQCSIRILKW